MQVGVRQQDTQTKFLKEFQSQFGQDLHVFYNHFLRYGPKYRGVFVDLAAAWPKGGSNSYFFEKCLGWRGLCIEAHPHRASLLRAERSCTVVEYAVTATDYEDVFFQVPNHTGTNHVVLGGPNGGDVVNVKGAATTRA